MPQIALKSAASVTTHGTTFIKDVIYTLEKPFVEVLMATGHFVKVIEKDLGLVKGDADDVETEVGSITPAGAAAETDVVDFAKTASVAEAPAIQAAADELAASVANTVGVTASSITGATSQSGTTQATTSTAAAPSTSNGGQTEGPLGATNVTFKSPMSGDTPMANTAGAGTTAPVVSEPAAEPKVSI
jgi:hypothetical protein